MQNKERFLKELAALTKRFNIKIEGCGCCASPFLVEEHDHVDKVYEVDGEYPELTYTRPTNKNAQT